MIADRGTSFGREADLVGATVGVAVIVGALSLVDPDLIALTGTLAVLAWAGWFVRSRRFQGLVPEVRRPAVIVALLVTAGGAVLFAAGAAAPLPARGLLLGVSLVPLWIAVRSGTWTRVRSRIRS